MKSSPFQTFVIFFTNIDLQIKVSKNKSNCLWCFNAWLVYSSLYSWQFSSPTSWPQKIIISEYMKRSRNLAHWKKKLQIKYIYFTYASDLIRIISQFSRCNFSETRQKVFKGPLPDSIKLLGAWCSGINLAYHWRKRYTI